MIKCALADVRNVPALVLQSDDLYYSGKLIMVETNNFSPVIAMVNEEEDDVFFLVYDKAEGIENPIFIEKADQENVDFVKHTKDNQTWVLILQVVMISDEDEKKKHTIISLMNIGESVVIKDPIVKDDWIVSL